MTLSRRTVLKSAGALVVAFSTRPAAALLPGEAPAERRFNERIELRADGTARIYIGRIEMGQGLKTAVAQLAAEELDLAITRIRVAPVDTEISPNEGFTDSSASIRRTGGAVREAAAEARAALFAMAAERLGVAAEGLRAEDGVIHAGARSVAYWDLIADPSLRVNERTEAVLKRPADYRLIGRAAPRIDLPAKFSGGAAFVQDLRLPGMLHARVVRPPSDEAELVALDEAPVRAAAGMVALVRDGRFLAVVAEREEQAIRAADILRDACRWRETASLPGRSGLFADLARQAGFDEASSVETDEHAATYAIPYRMHGAIGPSCAVARFEHGRLTVWTHSQGVYPLRAALADLLGLDRDAVRCIHQEGSGCYGHNGADDAAADAALIARAVPGRPIRLQWMRADEHLFEPYGPASLVRLRGALGADGRIEKWSAMIASGTHGSRPVGAANLLAARFVDPPQARDLADGLSSWSGGSGYNARPIYDVGAVSFDAALIRRPPLRTSALRSLGAYANVFAIESFMDELAASIGADPLAFRLRHLSDERERAVLETAAERFGWRDFQSAPGRGRGLGLARHASGACVAVAVEAEADADGGVRLLRATAAVDCGEIVNPDGVRNQIEGGVIQAASWTLKEQVDFDETRVLSRDWASYPILTMREAPDVEVVLLDRPGASSSGVGEAAAGPAAGAVANAASAALGRRVRTLPLKE